MTTALPTATPALTRPPKLGNTRVPAGVLTILICILLSAFAVRTYQLDFNDIEGDEAFSYAFSIDSLEGIVRTTLTIAEPHPVASYFINHFWLLLAGGSEFAFRYESVLFGVASVALIYRLGRRLGLSYRKNSRVIPVIASVLVAFSPFLIGESRNGRMYSLSLMLTLFSTWLAVELLMCAPAPLRSNQRGLRATLAAALSPQAVKFLIAYVLVSYLALNTHYFTGTILLAQNVFMLAVTLRTPLKDHWRRLTRWVIAQMVILIAFAPWYLLVRDMLHNYPGASYFSPTAEFMVRLMAGVFAVGQNASPVQDMFALLAGLALVVGVVRLSVAGPRQRWSAVLLVSLLCVPFILSYLDSRGRSTFAERQVIATSAPFYLLVAAAIAPIWETGRNRIRLALQVVPPVVLAVGICAGLAIGLRGSYLANRNTPSSWKPFVWIVKTFSANVTPEQFRVAQNVPEPAMTFYYSGYPAAFNIPARAIDLPGAIADAKALADAGVERVILREDADHWWNGGKGKDIAHTALSTQYTRVNQIFTGRWWIYMYSRANPADLKPIGISYSNGLKLQAALARPMTEMRTTVKGKVLEVYLQWNTDNAKLSGAEKIFIHVLDQNNQVPSQLDLALTDADIHTPIKTYGIPISDDMKPGTYVIRVGLYDPSKPGAPRLRTSDNSDGIQIGTLSIED